MGDPQLPQVDLRKKGREPELSGVACGLPLHWVRPLAASRQEAAPLLEHSKNSFRRHRQPHQSHVCTPGLSEGQAGALLNP